MKYILLLVLASIACGQTAQLPNAVIVAPNVPTVASTAYHIVDVTDMVVPTPVTVITLGTLNIRELPDTNSAVLGWYEAGVTVTVVAQVDGIGCPNWYLVTHRGGRGYICAEWCSK
jgi:uncharacterized protein YgiM (DUF1202 family)